MGFYAQTGEDMSTEFDIQLSAKNLFRFNLYQTYTTSQGPLSVVLAVIVAVIAGYCFNQGNTPYGILYVVVAIVILVYIPFTLWTRAKRTMKKNTVLAGKLSYTLDEEGVGVEQDGDTGLLSWDKVFKVVASRDAVLIYSSRVNAYILPKNQLGDKYEEVKAVVKENLPDYRVRLK